MKEYPEETGGISSGVQFSMEPTKADLEFEDDIFSDDLFNNSENVWFTDQNIQTIKKIHEYLENRKEIIKRKSEFELAKARERAHILAGLRIALSNLDEVNQLIRESKDSEEA